MREMDNPNHPERNVIISMSDLHLDSIWSKNENNRIQTFLKDLVELAKVRYSTETVFCRQHITGSDNANDARLNIV